MKVLQIAKAGPGKPNIFIEGGMYFAEWKHYQLMLTLLLYSTGIHAREWISPAVVTYTIRELLENYAAHPQYVDEFNIHVIPSANPDGYEYTRSDVRLLFKRTVHYVILSKSYFRIVPGENQEA